jgi:predicted ATPase
MGTTITPTLVGRNQQYRLLENALADALADSGRCVLVSGEAGIGKTRLLAEIRMQARHRGFTDLVGRCFQQDMAIPYAPLIDMLRMLFARRTIADSLDFLGSEAPEIARLLPELAVHVSPAQSVASLGLETERRRLFDALATVLLRQTATQPVALIVEDIHWADAASLSFLLFLARGIVASPFILLLSYRPSETNDALVNLLTAFDRDPLAQTLQLQPLTRSEVGQMLRAILDQQEEISFELVTAIHSLTDGNPFFIEEVFTALIASRDIYFDSGSWRRKPLAQMIIPDSVQRLVRQRLDRVSPQAAQFLNLAAISGRTFDFGVLQTLTGHNDSEMLALIKELIHNQLVIEERTDQFAFRHALTREALYLRLLARERQILHGQMAEAIERTYTDTLESHLETLAHHFFEGANWAKALEYARRAGVKAQALYAPHATITQVTRALTAARYLSPPPPLVDLYRLSGQAHDLLGEFDEAKRDFEAALEVARKVGALHAAWQVLLDLGMLWASRSFEQTGNYCRQALDLAQSMNDKIAIGHSLNRLGNWMMNSGQPFAALEYHEQALTLFEGLNDRSGIAATLDLLAMTSNQAGDAVGTVEYYERAIPILRDLNDLQTLCSSLTNVSFYTMDEASLQEAVDTARQIDWRAGEAYGLMYLGFFRSLRGEYGEALAVARSGLALAEAIEHRLWIAWGNIVLGQIYFEQFALDEAYHCLIDK